MILSSFLRHLCTLVTGFGLGAFTIWYNVQGDRADFTISEIGFEPFPLVPNRRTYIALTVKNTGRNYGTIKAAALDRVDDNRLPDKPTYDPAQIIGERVIGADAKRIISDLGDKPLTFTQSDINGLANGHLNLKLIGYVSYDDEHWFLQSGIIGFCYVWNPTDANAGNFNECSERNYTYYRTYLYSPGITIRDYPALTASTQTMTPTTMPMRVPDLKHHFNTLEIRR